jgi:hypothetical protein
MNGSSSIDMIQPLTTVLRCGRDVDALHVRAVLGRQSGGGGDKGR